MMRDTLGQRIERIGVAGWRWNVTDDRFSGNMNRLLTIYDLPEGTAPGLERFLEHAHPDDLAEIRANLQNSLAHGVMLRIPHRAMRADGQRFVVSVGSLLTPPACPPAVMTGYTVDLTEYEIDPQTRLRLDDLATELDYEESQFERQQSWAQAKGALMAIYRCDADWAWQLVSHTARYYDIDVAVLVRQLLAVHHGDPVSQKLSGHLSEAVRASAHALGLRT